MARYTFKLPDIGEGTAEAELVAWHVQVGDRVDEDQPVADVMTDKATVELTAPVAGRVAVLHGSVGEMSAIGGPLIEFETDEEAAAPDNEQSKVETPAPAPAPPTQMPSAPAAAHNDDFRTGRSSLRFDTALTPRPPFCRHKWLALIYRQAWFLLATMRGRLSLPRSPLRSVRPGVSSITPRHVVDARFVLSPAVARPDCAAR